MEDGVQRIAPAEGQHRAQVAAEGPGARVALQEVVEGVHAAARPQGGAQRPQPLRPDDVARGGGQRPGRRQLDQGREARAVAGVAGVELLAARPHGLEGQGVDLVDRVADGGQAAGEQDSLQALGVRRQVAGGAEAAEGLPQHAPALDPQPPAQVLAVLDDLVGPHVAEQPGRAGGVSPGVRPVDGRGGAGAALVDEDEPVLLQDRADPAQSRVGRGPGGLAAGPALEEEQRRPGGRVDGRRAALGQGDLAGVDVQGPGAVGPAVAVAGAVEGDGQVVVAGEETGGGGRPGARGQADRGRAHDPTVIAAAGSVRASAPRTRTGSDRPQRWQAAHQNRRRPAAVLSRTGEPQRRQGRPVRW